MSDDLFTPSGTKATKTAETTEVKKAFDAYFTKRKPTDAHVALLFGDTASGKSFIAQSYPSPVIVIDTENRAIITKHQQYQEKDINIFEPVVIKNEFKDDYSALDAFQTIENVTQFIIDFSKEVKEGRFTKGTIVIDSCTDLWKYIQEWGIITLSKYTDKKGVPLASKELMRVKPV